MKYVYVLRVRGAHTYKAIIERVEYSYVQQPLSAKYIEAATAQIRSTGP